MKFLWEQDIRSDDFENGCTVKQGCMQVVI